MERASYDVVILGSGCGGISAAAMAVNSGYRTLLVERQSFLGGRCSSVYYKDFIIPTGAPWLGDDGPLAKLARETGGNWEIRCPEPPQMFNIDGKDEAMPAKGGLMHIMSKAAGSEEEARKVMNAMRRALTWEEPSPLMSIWDWLHQYTSNPGIEMVFEWTAMHGTHLWEWPVSDFFKFFIVNMPFRRFGFAPHGAIALMKSLGEAIEAKGGDIWKNCPATRIKVEGGVATGVVVERDGELVEVEAKAVISNVGPKGTVTLAGRESFDSSYLREVAESYRPIATTIVWFESKKPYHEYPGWYNVVKDGKLRPVFHMTNLCPELAPPGKHLLSGGYRPDSCALPYDASKGVEMAIWDARNFFPDFDKNCKMLLAQTFWKDWPVQRSWPGYSLRTHKTPVEMLYNVGDGVLPEGWSGTHACVEDSRRVMEDLAMRLKPAAAAAKSQA
ncbi:MAG: FAD-dependent oxidoreductase [Dehalococcoidia bacterium]